MRQVRAGAMVGRWLAGIGLLCGVAAPQETGSRGLVLARAKAQYAGATDELRGKLDDALTTMRRNLPDGPGQGARGKQIEVERTELASNGTWPASLRSSPFAVQRSSDRTALAKAYYAAMGDCNRSDNLAEHQALSSELAAFQSFDDLADWNSLTAYTERGNGPAAWERSGDSIASRASADAPGIPLTVLEKPADARAYVLAFEITNLDGVGLAIQALDTFGQPIGCRITREQFTQATASHVFGGEGAHVTISTLGAYSKIEMEGSPIARETRTAGSSAEAVTSDSAWFTLSPDAGARVTIDSLRWKRLNKVDPQNTYSEPARPASSARTNGKRSAALPKATWYDVLEQDPDPSAVTNAEYLQAIRRSGYPWRVRHRTSKIEMLLVPVSADLSKFLYVGRYEVQVNEWRHVLDGEEWTEQLGLPALNIGWTAVHGFLAKAGDLRLPTGAEWEFMCRAGTSDERYGTLDDIAWHVGNSGKQGHRVGLKAPNALGLFDTIGNAFEWCSEQALRGGSWRRPEPKLTCTAGYVQEPSSLEDPGPSVGFRVVHATP